MSEPIYLTPMARALAKIPETAREGIIKIAHRHNLAPTDRRWEFLEKWTEHTKGMTPEQARDLLRETRAALYGETPEQFEAWEAKCRVDELEDSP